MWFLFQTPALHQHQPPGNTRCKQPAMCCHWHSVLWWGFATSYHLSQKKKIQVIQKVKSSLREKWAPANSASCTSSYCRPSISISFVIALEALQLPIQKIQQCWGSHNLHFSHSTASLPRHARTSGQHICALMHSVTSAAAPAKAQTLLQAATSNPCFTWGNRKHYFTE